MSITLQDGKGRGNKAGINAQNKLLTTAETGLIGHYVSVRDGQCFNSTSITASAAAGAHVLYFKNTSADKDFFIDLLRVGGLNAAMWKIWVATGTAAGGSDITPTNLNLKSGVTAAATTRGSGTITGVTVGALLASVRTAASSSTNIPFDDILILGTNDAIVVEYDTGTTGACEVLMRGYFLNSSTEI